MGVRIFRRCTAEAYDMQVFNMQSDAVKSNIANFTHKSSK